MMVQKFQLRSDSPARSAGSGSTDTGGVAGDSSEMFGFYFFADKAVLNIHIDDHNVDVALQ